MVSFQGNSNTKDMGYFGMTRSDPGDGDLYNASHHEFVVYSYNSSTKVRLDYREFYILPTITADLTEDKSYNILTTKNTITVGQGGTGRATLTANAVLYGNGTSAIGMLASANGAVYATAANGTLHFGTLPTGQGGTGNTSYTANRLVWTETATKFTAGYHYASSTKIGVCYTSEPSYNFAVSGTSYFNGNTTHNGIDYFANGTTYYINNSANGYLNKLQLKSDLTFDATGTTGTAGGIYWSGSTDGAQVYYTVPSSDAGILVINMTDDANARISLRTQGTERIGIDSNGTYVNTQLQRAGKSVSWYQGRTTAIIKTTSYSGYDAILSMKTTAGDWSLGVYTDNICYLTYILDSNYNANTNTITKQFYFKPDGTIGGNSFTGNAATATKLQTARAINGTNFDGSAAITTANWGTARTITIGGTGKSVNGSGNVSWSKAEILGSSTNANFYRGDQTWSNTLNGAFTANGTITANGGYLKSTANSNTVTIGSQNTSWCHIYNSASIPFIFNNTVCTTTGDLGHTSYPFANLILKSGGRVSANGGNLYLGNSNNAGWVYLQDCASQASGTPWKLTQAGVLTFVSGTMTGNLTVTSTGNNRATVFIRSAAAVPMDLYLGSNNTNYWSISCRESTNPWLGFYWAGGSAGWALTMGTNRHIEIPVHAYVGGYNNTSYSLSTASFICNSWIRTVGNTGWYNETHGGGMYMEDNTWVRVSHSKKFYVANNAGDAINTAGGATISGTVSAGKIDIRPGTNNWAMQVGANQWGGTGILNGNGDGTGDGTGDLSIASWYGIIFQDGTNWATKAGINCRTGVYYGKGFSNTSSILVKENIKSLSEDKARQILLTRPVSFDYKKEFGGMKNQFGLIAEELEEILPELVQQPADEKGYKHINYSLIIPFLIKLAQSQQKEIDQLKLQINDLI